MKNSSHGPSRSFWRKNYGKAHAITEAIVERYAPDVVAAIFGKTDKEQRWIVLIYSVG